MSNGYWSGPSEVDALTRARSATINDIETAASSAFDKLPAESDLKNGTTRYAVDSGAANAYVVTLTYPPASYADGLEICMKPSATNTGASTINVNSLGVKSIVAPDGTALVAGALPANGMMVMRYNSTTGKFYLINPATMFSASSTYATIGGVETLSNKTLDASCSVASDFTLHGVPQDDSGPLRSVPQNVQNTDYTCVLGDSGKHVVKTDSSAHAYTVPPNSSVAFVLGTVLTFVNEGGTTSNVTVTQGSGVSIYRAGTAANITVTPGDMVTLLKVGTDTWQA